MYLPTGRPAADAVREAREEAEMKRIFYGWWIVLATNLICLLGFGTWLYSFGVFFKPMMNEFGWTRAMTAGAASLRSIEGGVAGPVVGWAVDKYGARRVITSGIVSGSAPLMPFVDSLLGFYLAYGILVSIGMSAMLYLPAFTVIAKWFRRKLSRALAVLAVGAGLGGLVCAPAATLVIQHFGWRIAFLGMGILMWLVVIPLAMVVRERPEDMGLRPDGDPPEGAPGAGGSEVIPAAGGGADYTLKQALASSAFWVIALTFFFSSLSHSVVFVHAIPALTDAGISAELAAFSVGLLTVVSIAGRLSFGYLGDSDKRYLPGRLHPARSRRPDPDDRPGDDDRLPLRRGVRRRLRFDGAAPGVDPRRLLRAGRAGKDPGIHVSGDHGGGRHRAGLGRLSLRHHGLL
jgi:sugar phosphate permease